MSCADGYTLHDTGTLCASGWGWQAYSYQCNDPNPPEVDPSPPEGDRKHNASFGRKRCLDAII